MFSYESNYHLGLALQNLNRHKEAIFAYNKAINVMSVPKVSIPLWYTRDTLKWSANIFYTACFKNGCLAGCNSTSSFQTPVLAKRAFANAKIGNMRNAFIDIDKAIQLDPKNSDLYCIRYIHWSLHIFDAVCDLLSILWERTKYGTSHHIFTTYAWPNMTLHLFCIVLVHMIH